MVKKSRPQIDLYIVNKSDKAKNTAHILGCLKSIVKCVIEIRQVKIATDSDYMGQKIFNTLANFNTEYYNLIKARYEYRALYIVEQLSIS